MFGYVVPFIPELKVRDRDLYRSYYCGLCRALGRYGVSSKLTLTYDAAFAALLLAGVTGLAPSFSRRACALHPLRGRVPTVDNDSALDFAAALSILLAKYKLLDDARDGRPLRKAALPPLRGAVRRAERKYPETARALSEALSRFGEIEASGSCDPDEAPMSFGEMLGSVLASCPAIPGEERPAVTELGRKLGCFIYVIDAWDDRREDAKRNSFNIFLRSSMEDPRETCSAMLDMYIHSAVLAYDLLDISANKSLLDNIMYLGLSAKAVEILKKTDEKGAGA